MPEPQNVASMKATLSLEATEFTRQLRQVKQEMQGASLAMQEAEAANRVLQKDIDATSAKQKLAGAVTRQQAQLERELAGAKAQLRAMLDGEGRAVQDVVSKYTLLTAAQQNELIEVRKQIAAQAELATAAKKAADDRVKAEEAAAKRIEAARKNLGQNVRQAGQSLTQNLTVPILGAGALAIGAGNQVQAAQSQIAQRSGATGQTLAGLNQTFQQLGGRVPQSIGDTAAAIGDLYARTRETGPQLQSLAKAELDLARITNSDVQPTIKVTTEAFRAWGITAEQQVPALDALARAHQLTGVSLQTLASDVSRAAPAMRGFGLSFSQSVAVVASFEQANIPALRAISGLQTGLSKLAKAGVTDAHQALGILIARMTDAKNPMQALREATQIFGARFGAQFVDAVRSGKVNIDALSKALDAASGTIARTGEQSKTAAQRFAEEWNKAKLAVAPLGIALLELGVRALKWIDPLVTGLGHLADSFGRLSPLAQQALAGLGLALAALGPGMVALGNIIIGFQRLGTAWTTARTLLLGTEGLGGVATAAEGATVAVEGTGAAVTGLGALLAPELVLPLLAVTTAWSTNFLGLRDTVGRFAAALQTQIPQALDFLKEHTAQTARDTNSLWQSALETIRGESASFFDIFHGDWAKGWDVFVDITSGRLDRLKEHFRAWRDDIRGYVNQIANNADALAEHAGLQRPGLNANLPRMQLRNRAIGAAASIEDRLLSGSTRVPRLPPTFGQAIAPALAPRQTPAGYTRIPGAAPEAAPLPGQSLPDWLNPEAARLHQQVVNKMQQAEQGAERAQAVLAHGELSKQVEALDLYGKAWDRLNAAQQKNVLVTLENDRREHAATEATDAHKKAIQARTQATEAAMAAARRFHAQTLDLERQLTGGGRTAAQSTAARYAGADPQARNLALGAEAEYSRVRDRLQQVNRLRQQLAQVEHQTRVLRPAPAGPPVPPGLTSDPLLSALQTRLAQETQGLKATRAQHEASTKATRDHDAAVKDLTGQIADLDAAYLKLTHGSLRDQLALGSRLHVLYAQLPPDLKALIDKQAERVQASEAYSAAAREETELGDRLAAASTNLSDRYGQLAGRSQNLSEAARLVNEAFVTGDPILMEWAQGLEDATRDTDALAATQSEATDLLSRFGKETDAVSQRHAELLGTSKKTTEAQDLMNQALVNGDPLLIQWAEGLLDAAKANEALDAKQKAAKKSLEEQTQIIGRFARGTADVIGNTLQNLMQHGFKNFFADVIQGFKEMFQQIALEIIRSAIEKKIRDALMPGAAGGGGSGGASSSKGGGILGLLQTGMQLYAASQGLPSTGASLSGGSFSGPAATDSAFGNLSVNTGAFAGGGAFGAGNPMLVGEYGPEMIFPTSGGRVQPAAAGGGVVIHQNFQIQAADVNSFRRSMPQMLADAHRQAELARRRGG